MQIPTQRRSPFPFRLLPACALLFAAGCDTGINGGLVGYGENNDLSAGDGGHSVGGGLPCAVANLFQRQCVSCHGRPTANGASNSLMNRDDLLAESLAYPGTTNAQRSLFRINANTMPPGGGVSGADRAALADWINRGTPVESCDNVVDAGAPRDLTYVPSDSGPPGTGLPCDLAQLLENRCSSCHGTPLRSNAPMRLTTRDDLIAKSPADPNATLAERSVLRMMQNQMPPNATNPPADIAVFQNWINAGYPVGNCGPGTDGGVIPDPLNAAPTCTSKKTQQQTNRGSQTMNPGEACIDCHRRQGEGPIFNIAGTLYATGHEPDLCAGVNGQNVANAVVVITDANNMIYNLRPNSSGNFSLQSRTFLAPYTAKVTFMMKERPMAAKQTNGDCNVCHTQNGTQNAPGRVTLPAL